MFNCVTMFYSRFFVIAALALALAGCGAKATRPETQIYRGFGEFTWSEDIQPQPVSKVLAVMQNDQGGEVVITGVVADVCKRRGCWLTITEPGLSETVFVKFTCPIEGRLIPMEAIGKRVAARGTLERVEVTEAFARHLKEDAGASPEEIEQIKGPQQMLRLASPGARVYGLEGADVP